jgi:hypothetical protein
MYRENADVPHKPFGVPRSVRASWRETNWSRVLVLGAAMLVFFGFSAWSWPKRQETLIRCQHEQCIVSGETNLSFTALALKRVDRTAPIAVGTGKNRSKALPTVILWVENDRVYLAPPVPTSQAEEVVTALRAFKSGQLNYVELLLVRSRAPGFVAVGLFALLGLAFLILVVGQLAPLEYNAIVDLHDGTLKINDGSRRDTTVRLDHVREIAASEARGGWEIYARVVDDDGEEERVPLTTRRHRNAEEVEALAAKLREAVGKIPTLEEGS